MMLAYLIILVIFSSCCASQLHLGYYYPQSPQVYYRPRIDNDKVDKNCVCFSKVGATVADVLQGDQQRVAVYLYRDQYNNLRVLTPNRENQLLLPDLRVGPDDLIVDVDTESTEIQNLFNLNLAVELKTNASEVGTVVDVNSSVLEEQENFEDFIEPDVAAVDDIQTDDVPSVNSELESNLAPLGNLHDDERSLDDDSPNLDYIISPNNEPGAPIITAVSNEESFNSAETFDDDLSLPLIDVSESSNTVGYTISPIQSSQNPYTFKTSVTAVPGLQSTSLPNDPKNFGPIGFQESGFQESGFQVSGSSAFQESGSSGFQDSGLQSQSVATVSNLRPEDSLSNVGLVNEIYNAKNEYVTFDRWFDLQMQRIQNIGEAPNSNIDVSSIKNLLEKALYENAMYVTMDGVLINSKGDALNVGNLKLRPILIGDSVAYDRVFVNGLNKYELPINLPYLEAILVTSANPPKILGVIPLGKTYVPRVSYRRNFDYWDLKSRSSKPISAANRKKLEPLQGKPVVKTRLLPSASHVLLRNSNARKTSVPLTVKLLPAKSEAETQPHVHRKFGIARLLKNKISNSELKNAIKSLLIERLQARKQKVSSQYKDDDEVLDEYEKPIEVEEYEEEEQPWFRIIGGNAATSSGTPVSSKGRSAYPYSYAYG